MIYILQAETSNGIEMLGYFTRKENAIIAQHFEKWKEDGYYETNLVEIPSYEGSMSKVHGESWISTHLGEINEFTKIDFTKDLLPNNKIYDIFHETNNKNEDKMNQAIEKRNKFIKIIDEIYPHFSQVFIKEYIEQDQKYNQKTIILEEMKACISQMKKQVKKKEKDQKELDTLIEEFKAITHERGTIKSARTKTISRFESNMKKAYQKDFDKDNSLYISIYEKQKDQEKFFEIIIGNYNYSKQYTLYLSNQNQTN